MKAHVALRIAALVASAVLAGCLGRTPPPQLYLLTALGSQPEPSARGTDLAVGVGPVTVPEYLRRSEIVTRAGCGTGTDFCSELRVDELHRWAEPLEEAVDRVLAENLSLLLATERVVRYPWRPSAALDYQVTVDVIRFDADASGRSVLTARWAVIEPENGEILHLSRSSFEERVAGEVYGARISALSRGLAKLAREVADTLESHAD